MRPEHHNHAPSMPNQPAFTTPRPSFPPPLYLQPQQTRLGHSNLYAPVGQSMGFSPGNHGAFGQYYGTRSGPSVHPSQLRVDSQFYYGQNMQFGGNHLHLGSGGLVHTQNQGRSGFCRVMIPLVVEANVTLHQIFEGKVPRPICGSL